MLCCWKCYNSKHMKRTHSHNSNIIGICCKRFGFPSLLATKFIDIFFFFYYDCCKYWSILSRTRFDRFSRWKFDHVNEIYFVRKKEGVEKFRNTSFLLLSSPFFPSKVQKLFLDFMVEVAPKRILTLLFDLNFFFSPLKSSNNIY